MPPRKSKTTIDSPAPIATVPTAAPTAAPTNALSLPESLSVALPDFSSQVPTDWFDPSSSSVPVVDSEAFKQKSEIARGQSNALQLQAMNLDNAILSVGNAVKATKIGELLVGYQIGIERIRTASVKLLEQRTITANSQISVQIAAERGSQLSAKLQGEATKTQTEQVKNQGYQLDLQGAQGLLQVAEQSWKNRLAEAEQRNSEMLQKFN